MRWTAWTLIALLIVFKLWLVADMQMTAMTNATLDDRLYVKLAEYLAQGDWLGPYNYETLVKSPFYSIWIAVSYRLHVPLWLSQQLLHLAACLLLVVALRPWLRNPWLLAALFAIMWLDPRMYDEQALRVAREGIYLSVSFLVIAFAAGLLFRTQSNLKVLLPWACGLGVSLAAMWLTREEGMWLVPPVLLILTYVAFRFWREKHLAYRGIATVFILPWLILLAGIAGVSAMNYYHYGAFVVGEIKAQPYQSAYGAMTRVKHEPWRQYVSVPRETRLRIYAASSRFAELEQWFEHFPGTAWGQHGAKLVDPPDVREIAGGWFVWAFRDAVNRAGYHDNAAEAAAYYSTLAEEINRSCESGILDCGPRRVSNIDPWRSPYISLLPPAVWVGFRTLVEYRYDRVARGLSYGDEEGVALFESLTRWRAAPLFGTEAADAPPRQSFRFRLMQLLFSVYSTTLPIASVIGLACWTGVVIYSVIRRRSMEAVVLTVALLGAMLARMLILGYITITSFHATNILYMAPLYPILYVFIFVSVLAALRAVRCRGGYWTGRLRSFPRTPC